MKLNRACSRWLLSLRQWLCTACCLRRQLLVMWPLQKHEEASSLLLCLYVRFVLVSRCCWLSNVPRKQNLTLCAFTSDRRSKAEATPWIIWLCAPMITVGQFVYVSVLEVVFGSAISPLVLVNMIKDEGSMFFHWVLFTHHICTTTRQ